MQEVVDAALLEKVKTPIERNKSLQMLDIFNVHDSIVEAVLKGARGNTSLKKLTIRWLSIPDRRNTAAKHWQQHLKAAAELRQVRPQLELVVH